MNPETVLREKLIALGDSEEPGESRAQVLTAACALAHELRAQGLPPERVVVQVKAVIRGLRSNRTPDRELMDEIVLTCIEEYFRPVNGLQ